MPKEPISFEKVQALAEKRGVAVCLHDKPGWCLVDMDSPFNPDQRLPPLTFETAAMILKEYTKQE